MRIRLPGFLLAAVVLALLMVPVPAAAAEDDDGGDGDPGPDGHHIVFDGALLFDTLLVAPGESGVRAGAFDCTSFVQRSLVHSLDVSVAGTGLDPVDLLAVRLVIDANGNEMADDGETLLGELTVPADDGAAQFDVTAVLGAPLVLQVEEPLAFVLEVDLAATTIEGSTFRFAVTACDAVDVTDKPVAAMGLGFDGPTATGTLVADPGIEPALALSALPVADVEASGGQRVVVGRIRAVVSGGALALQSLGVLAIGTLNDAVDIPRVELFRDTNSSGEIEGLDLPGGDVRLGHGAFVHDNGAIQLTAALQLPAGGAADLLIALTLSDSAPVGGMAGIEIHMVTTHPSAAATGLPIPGSSVTVVPSADGSGTANPPGTGEAVEPEFDDPLVFSPAAGCGAGTGQGPLRCMVVAVLLLAARRFRLRA